VCFIHILLFIQIKLINICKIIKNSFVVITTNTNFCLTNKFIMKINNYSYDDFIVYSLSYFGLAGIVEKKIKTSSQDVENIQHTLMVMEDCNKMDLSDKAKNFRILYRHFCLKNKINKDKLISDMLSFCA